MLCVLYAGSTMVMIVFRLANARACMRCITDCECLLCLNSLASRRLLCVLAVSLKLLSSLHDLAHKYLTLNHLQCARLVCVAPARAFVIMVVFISACWNAHTIASYVQRVICIQCCLTLLVARMWFMAYVRMIVSYVLACHAWMCAS
jgi:hypothetical protein